MEKILELISKEVAAAFEEAGYDAELGKATLSNRPDLCEYQCNGAMAGAKKYGKAPFMIADEVAEKFMECFAKFKPESIKNEYYSDLLTYLEDDISVEHTRAHFIYAKKMGEKYLRRYKKYFHNPDIREFDMQHEQWLLGEERFTLPVLEAIDDFMNMPV